MPFAVRGRAPSVDPDVAVAIDVDAVRKDEHARAEALHQLAGRIELQHRIEIGTAAAERLRGIDARRRP